MLGFYCILPAFSMDKCDKWKDGCRDCHRYREYSFFFDRSRELYNKKKKASEGLDLTIITPSQWLAGLVKQSFFKNYPVKVINNGIDLGIFKPAPSDFRAKHGIPNDKYIVLGVAFGWGKRKGLDVFIELSKRLDKEKYQIILVGTDEKSTNSCRAILSLFIGRKIKESLQRYIRQQMYLLIRQEKKYLGLSMLRHWLVELPELLLMQAVLPSAMMRPAAALFRAMILMPWKRDNPHL